MSKAGGDFQSDSGATARECRSCGLSTVCGIDKSVDRDTPLRGAPLALYSLGFFILPLATAIGGAAFGGAGSVGQLIGGLVGLGVGMLVAKWAFARPGLVVDYKREGRES